MEEEGEEFTTEGKRRSRRGKRGRKED